MSSLFADLALDAFTKAGPETVATPDTNQETATQTITAGLNEPQRDAVVHEGSPLLIVAGAGSGKTRVLTHRIAHLLDVRKQHPGSILAITFTNKAAAEMRERINTLVGARAQRMWISTFHSSCARILRFEAKNIGLSSNFSIYDSADSQRLLTLIIRDLDLDPRKVTARMVANHISGLKNELIDAETYASDHDTSNPLNPIIAQIYSAYADRMRRAAAVDFDDLIMLTVNMLQAFPHIAEHYRRRFRHILVDEYQDTNHAQYSLIKELCGGPHPAELTVVGDSDQSIYAFRGATIRNIEEFEADFADAKTITLEQNYRSTQNILTAANAVIQQNEDRRPKNLWTDSGDGELITGYIADNEHDEATFIADEIDSLADDHGVVPGDIAIFYRTNNQSRSLEEVLIRVGLPYRIIGGTRFYERREIKDAIAYLKVLANPDDDVNLRRILNVPKRGIGDRAAAALSVLAEQNRTSFFAAIKDAESAPGLATRSLKNVTAFRDLLEGLMTLVESQATPATILEAVLDESGYLAELQDSQDPQDESRLENLDELLSVAAEFEEAAPEGTLIDFLERISLVADADSLAEEAGEDGVITLMTLHTAKGLEFPVVFLTGMEDGIFPHMRALNSTKDIAEERRLAYVGLTRARERLYLTRATVRSAFGSAAYNPASRFLSEIPDAVIRWQGVQQDSVPSSTYSSGSPTVARLQQPTTPPPRSTGKKKTIHLDVGDRVTHETFGLGTVLEVHGEDAKSMAHIEFRDVGVKRLLLRYAPVEKL